MKQFKSNKLAASLAGGCLLSLVMAAQSAVACTVDNWTGNSNTVTPGSVVADSPSTISRYSGLCGMETAASTTAWVQDDSPGGINRIRARFYVLLDITDVGRIYRGFNSGGSPIFDIAVNPVNGNISLVSSGQSAVCAGCANVGGWNSIEIDWNAGGNQMSLIVNENAPVGSALSTGETVDFVRLGNLNGAAGTLSFDAYESRRATAIGRLCVGDANLDGQRGLADLEDIFAEFQFGTLANGNPDADENGEIGIGDLEEVFQIFQFGTAGCPAP